MKLCEHPQSQHKVFGTEVTFSVSATGAGAISYQWMKDGTGIELKSNNGIHMKASTLHISPFSKEHEGNYMCMVKNEDSELQTRIANLRGMKLVVTSFIQRLEYTPFTHTIIIMKVSYCVIV